MRPLDRLRRRRKSGSREPVAQLVLPVAAVGLGLVEDLEAEDVVLELSAELLPGGLLAGLVEIARDFPLVGRVGVAFQVLALALDHEHAMMGSAVVRALDHKIGVDSVPTIPLDRKVLRTDAVAVSRDHVGVIVEPRGSECVRNGPNVAQRRRKYGFGTD